VSKRSLKHLSKEQADSIYNALVVADISAFKAVENAEEFALDRKKFNQGMTHIIQGFVEVRSALRKGPEPRTDTLIGEATT
jgi:hypothetical protein